MDVRDFTHDDVVDAGRLLAAHRRREPLLPPQYEAASSAQALVEQLWSREGASGAVALDDGRRAHYVLVPAGDATVLELWWRLGFGLQHVHGVREAARSDGHPGIRSARAEDVPALAELDRLLPQHQARAPVFSSAPVPTLDEALGDWPETLQDERFAVFVGEDGGRVVGSAVACPVELSAAHSGLGDRAWAKRCWTRRTAAALGAWSPTGGRRTCCPRAHGRSSATARPSGGCTPSSASERGDPRVEPSTWGGRPHDRAALLCADGAPAVAGRCRAHLPDRERYVLLFRADAPVT